MSVLGSEKYRQNGIDILKVLLKPTKNFPEGYLTVQIFRTLRNFRTSELGTTLNLICYKCPNQE